MILSPYWKFGLLMATSLAFWWRPIVTTLRLALEHEEHTHILLIVPLCCALIYQQRKAIHAFASGTRGVSVGLALLAIGLLAATFAYGEAGSLRDDSLLAVSMGG